MEAAGSVEFLSLRQATRGGNNSTHHAQYGGILESGVQGFSGPDLIFWRISRSRELPSLHFCRFLGRYQTRFKL